MSTREIAFSSNGIELRGTLLTPPGAGPYPTALILAGSGPLDRDGNHKRMALGVSRDLAAIIASKGWASFRFDKRGVGASGGDYLSAGFYDERADAEAALMHLQTLPEIGPLVVIGHSAGAVFAGDLAALHPEIAGAILLATPATNGEETMVWQAGQIEGSVPKLAKFVMRLFRTSLRKQQAKAIAKLKATTTDVARIQMARINAKWMREFMAHDPLPQLKAATPPLLAITGTKDVQVNAADLQTIAEANPRAETHAVEDVDHILRHEPAPVSNPGKYKKQLEKPIDSRVTALITEWLGRIN